MRKKSSTMRRWQRVATDQKIIRLLVRLLQLVRGPLHDFDENDFKLLDTKIQLMQLAQKIQTGERYVVNDRHNGAPAAIFARSSDQSVLLWHEEPSP